MYDISGPEEFVLGRTTRVEDVWTGVWRVQRVRGEVDFSWKNIESFSEGGGGGEVDFVGVNLVSLLVEVEGADVGEVEDVDVVEVAKCLIRGC